MNDVAFYKEAMCVGYRLDTTSDQEGAAENKAQLPAALVWLKTLNLMPNPGAAFGRRVAFGVHPKAIVVSYLNRLVEDGFDSMETVREVLTNEDLHLMKKAHKRMTMTRLFESREV